MYKVIDSGSNGNAVLYFGEILVDCGVPYSHIEPYADKIRLILLTHSHKDHINTNTIERLCKNKPLISIVCCEWLYEIVSKITPRVFVTKLNVMYNCGEYEISPFKLYHDVPNCGWRIIKDRYKIFHATDTQHLEGITAKDYDLFAIEQNYDEDIIQEVIEYKKENGMFPHEIGSINSHLSTQQAMDFFIKNRKADSIIISLHESRTKNGI